METKRRKMDENKVDIGNISTESGDVNVAGRDNNIFQRITNIFVSGNEQQRSLRNRQNMLKLVWNTWIEGHLKKSLYNNMLIHLNLETQPDAVERPWDMLVQMPDQESEPLAPEMNMVDIFDRMNGAMLILGEPGSGKTTILLELCRQLILRAEEDIAQPIPVVFILSSWIQDVPLDQWLVEELRSKYYISEKIARAWVEDNRLLLLMDGFDEVNAKHREECVHAINNFHEQHDINLVICSRTNPLRTMKEKLKLHGAVQIKPLTQKQVRSYLERFHFNDLELGDLSGDLTELHELLDTPQMLNLLVLSGQGLSSEGRNQRVSKERFRNRLFNLFIRRMFLGRGVNDFYTPERTIRSLRWLADQLINQDQVLFYLESLTTKFVPQQKKAVSLAAFIVFGLIGGLLDGLRSGLADGLLSGVAFGLGGAYAIGISTEPAERLSWSWDKSRFKEKLEGSVEGGIVFGLGAWLIVGGISAFQNGLLVGIFSGLVAGLFLMLFLWLYSLLAGLLESSALVSTYEEVRTLPGKGVRVSFWNGLKMMLIFGLYWGLIGFLFSSLLNMLVGGPTDVLKLALVVGVFAVLIGGWKYGLGFVINHYLVRFFLSLTGRLPWNLPNFLHDCTDRTFLHHVGGGYIFTHRTLLDHFASLDDEKIKTLVADIR